MNKFEQRIKSILLIFNVIILGEKPFNTWRKTISCGDRWWLDSYQRNKKLIILIKDEKWNYWTRKPWHKSLSYFFSTHLPHYWLKHLKNLLSHLSKTHILKRLNSYLGVSTVHCTVGGSRTFRILKFHCTNKKTYLNGDPIMLIRSVKQVNIYLFVEKHFGIANIVQQKNNWQHVAVKKFQQLFNLKLIDLHQIPYLQNKYCMPYSLDPHEFHGDMIYLCNLT